MEGQLNPLDGNNVLISEIKQAVFGRSPKNQAELIQELFITQEPCLDDPESHASPGRLL
jgi:hypothetical protein